VTVTGDYGTEPTVKFDKGLTAKSTERSVAIKGDGDAVQSGDAVKVQYTIFNGSTGESIDATQYSDDSAVSFTVGSLLPGLNKTIECSTVGSRVIGVIPPADAFQDAGSPDLGVGADDSLVFVADIVEITPPLTPAEWTENVPDVTFADDGTPTVAIPAGNPPTELLSTVLTEGDGPVVANTDTVTIDYQGTSWTTGEMFDQSFDKTADTRPVNTYVPGFTAAIVGQKVGSTVLVTIPPEDAYGTDPAAHPLGGQTLVFVVVIEAVS
jgi:peptidylprolyl isomerase